MLLSNFIKPKILLILICILFLLTRFYKITEIPPSLYWDEASIGYNAYSIVQTGKDEWGDFLPIHFRAFGEFKLPVYIYSIVPFIKIFGLNEFSVRFPAVLFSLGVVIFTYLLAKKIIKNEWAGLLAAFFVTISPWFFIFSRTGYEATAGLFFYLLGIYLLLKIKENPWFLFISVLSFILSIYSYNSFRIVTPLTIVSMFIWIPAFAGMTYLRNSAFPIIISILIVLLSMIPILRLYTLDTGGLSRFKAVGVEGGETFFKNYFSHFNLVFLITDGDGNLRSQQAGFGQLYLAELIFFLIGLMYVVKKKVKHGLLILLLLLLGPVPAAVTKESPHALRSIATVPFLAILSAFGVFNAGNYLKFRYFEIIAVAVFLGFFINYFVNFMNIYNVESSEAWQYGYKKIYTDYRDEFQKYERIIISDAYAQPYIFALFYLTYDPEMFRKEVARNSVDKWGFSTVSKFNIFEFGKVSNLLKQDEKRTLIFTTVEEPLRGGIHTKGIGEIKFLDGTVAFWVYQQ